MLRLANLRIQWYLILSYLLILLLPCITVSLIYNSAYHLVEEREVEASAISLNECMSLTDQQIQAIDSTLISLMQNTRILNLLSLRGQPQYKSPEASTVYTTYTELTRYLNFSAISGDLVIYMNNPDLVFDGGSFVYGRENFYNIGISYEGITYEEFKSSVLDKNHFRKVFGGVTFEKKKRSTNENAYVRESGFLYVNSLPLASGGGRTAGTAVVHVGGRINDILRRMQSDDYGATFIADEDFNLITGVFGERTLMDIKIPALTGDEGSIYRDINGQNMLITYKRSSYNGWYYILMSPMNIIMERLDNFRMLIIYITALALIVGVFLSLYFSNRHSKPIAEVLASLRTVMGEGGADYKNISRMVKEVVSCNQEMQKTLETQKLNGQSIFINGLFRGEYQDNDEILAQSCYFGLDMRAGAYCVMLLSFGTEDTGEPEYTIFHADIAQIFTSHVALRQTRFRLIYHPVSAVRLAVLLCFEEGSGSDDIADLKSIARQLSENGAGAYIHDIRCFVGGIVNELRDICLSYSEADAAFDICGARDVKPTGVFYRELRERTRSFFYPNEIRTKLVLLAVGGDGANVRKILTYIYEENFNKRAIGRPMAYALFSAMYTTIITIAADYNLGEDPQDFYKMHPGTLNPDKEFSRVCKCYEEIVNAANGGGAANSRSVEELEDFIRGNFTRNDLDIALTAGYFHLSQTYFSQYFKKQTGQTFSKYLETLRINAASDMLKDTTASIEEIAAKTGYSSDLSFRRAFKKVMGISPSQYRQK